MTRCFVVAVGVGVGVALSACALPRAETGRPGTPYDAAAAGALTAHELAQGRPEETVHAWHLQVAGDRATYYACDGPDTCTFRLVEAPAKSIVATKVVSRARPVHVDGTSGEEVDVVRLTLARDASTTRGGMSSDARGLVVR